MKALISIIFLLPLFQTLFALNYTNEGLNEGEGLRFQEEGELKLITRTFKTSFNINVGDIELLLGDTQKLLNESRETYRNDSNFMDQIDALQKELIVHQNVFSEIFQTSQGSKSRAKREIFELLEGFSYQNHDIKQAKPSKRSKRDVIEFFESFFFSEDVKKRNKDLETYHSTLNNLIESVKNTANSFENSVEGQNKSYYNLLKQSVIKQVELELESVNECLLALEMLQQRKKLSDIFVKFTQFGNALDIISSMKRKFGMDAEEMPYNRTHQYYYSLEASHQIYDRSFYLTVHIPLVEKMTRKLYRIYEVPSYNDGKLMITDVRWKYFAVGENDMVMFMDLKNCLNGERKGLRYCEIQSQIEKLTSNTSCLVKAYHSRKIDSILCETNGASVTQLTFIQLEDGQFYYYTPELGKTTLDIVCDSGSEKLVLNNHTGILTLDKTCTAKTEFYELVSTRTLIHEVKNLNLSIMYSEGEMEKTFRDIQNKFDDHSKAFKDLLDLRNEIRDVSDSESHNIQTGGMEIDLLVVFVTMALLVFLLIVLHSFYAKCCTNKSKKEGKDNIVVMYENDEIKTSKMKA